MAKREDRKEKQEVKPKEEKHGKTWKTNVEGEVIHKKQDEKSGMRREKETPKIKKC